MKAGSRAVGIRDVAAAAGVSVTTVSHVLNDVASARISAETRRKVQEAAALLDYGPDRLAQALRSRRTGILGLVSEDLGTAPQAGRMIHGADQAARARGYALMIAGTRPTSPEPDSLEPGVAALLDRRVDGLLYAAAHHRELPPPAGLGRVPAVLINAVVADAGFQAVVPDEYGGARAAVKLLLRAGHTRLGFLNSTAEVPAARSRLQGFLDTLAAAGLPAGSGTAPVAAASPDSAGGHAAALRMLQAGNPPSAVLCFNDRMAAGVYRAAAELGLAIPRDLSVVGFGNEEPIAESLHPGLTTVALPYRQMGAWAVNRLIDALEGPDSGPAPRPATLACTVVTRESVAAVLRPQGTFAPNHA